MVLKNMVEKLHPLERKVLVLIPSNDSFSKLVRASELQEVEVARALQWLENKSIIKTQEKKEELIRLGANGRRYRKDGLPERRLLSALEDSMEISEVPAKAGIEQQEVNIALGILKKRAAIDIEKTDSSRSAFITEQGKKLKEKKLLEEEFLEGEFPKKTAELSEKERFAYQELSKRKDIIKRDVSKEKTVSLTAQGKKITESGLADEDYIERLTPAIIKTGLWKKRKFRRYDVQINVPEIWGGKRHFVEQAMQYVKKVWLEMGFCEMKGSLVQTSFWNLDSLFVPQDHPARDEQDTFYIKSPKKGKLPERYAKAVKATHEDGWKTKSKGWQYKWSSETAKENLLRTHTTVLSAQTISKLKKQDLPAKFFSVKRVYRNETLSWKHLFEFVQVEGIVVDPDASFKHLVGYLKDFFKKLGFPDARVRPGHFPYTEPSAEVDVWHPKKKCWVELGGSGIFRPEVVQPLFGEPVPVLAWGLGLERSIIEYYGITDIRELYKNDLEQLRNIKMWLR